MKKAILFKGSGVQAILVGIQTYHEFRLIDNEPHALRRMVFPLEKPTERHPRDRTRKI